MEPAGVPAIIAYRGGDKFAALVPLVDELPDDADLSATTLETVMKRYVVLYRHAGYMLTVWTKAPDSSLRILL